MEGMFNIALGIERMLALHYFAGQFESFIPIHKGANPERALKRVHSAAWDSLLLDLPAFLLAGDPSEGIYLGFPCTSDKALSSIGRACSIEAVMCLAPKADKPLPVMGYNLSALERGLGRTLCVESKILISSGRNPDRYEILILGSIFRPSC